MQVIPVLSRDTNTWSGCLHGENINQTTTGFASFVLSVSGVSGDFVATTSCFVQAGVVTCQAL
ncbi:MAG: hypothetical protein H0U53_09595 [Actinobacteria bacterium]|nr:hypothetical protein [Actinomycetota bacterium]